METTISVRLTKRVTKGAITTNLSPTKIVCMGRNYKAHADEMGSTVPEEPILFLKPPSCLIGDGGTILLPLASKLIHHEVELAVIMERRARRIRRVDWLEYVYGYAIFLDITARDMQEEARKKGEPWTVSKGFDTFGPISPMKESRAIKDPHNLRVQLLRNGEMKQNSNTREMIFKIPAILEYASKIMTLERGDIIATGTPEGVGEIVDGDRLEAKIEGLGSLRVSVKRLRYYR